MPALAIAVFAAAIGTAVALLTHLTGPLARYSVDASAVSGAAVSPIPNFSRRTSRRRGAHPAHLPELGGYRSRLGPGGVGNLSLDDATLTTLCEKVIRSYDPCISCSAHFLTLTVERR
jgi:Ni,Fe-hydrogenase I large subunit